MKNSCGSFKHMRAVDGKQNLQFHWPKVGYANALISICQAVPGAPYSDNKYNNSARS